MEVVEGEGPVPTISQSIATYFPRVFSCVARRMRARSEVVEVVVVCPLGRDKEEGREEGRGRPFLLVVVLVVLPVLVVVEEEEDWPGRVKPALGTAGGKVESKGTWEDEVRRPKLYASARDSVEMPSSEAQR